MKLRFTLRATADLAEIVDYIRARNPSAANRVRAAIHRNLQTLVLFPRMAAGSGPKACEARHKPVSLSRLLRNDEAAGEIAILSISHPARRSQHSDA